MSFHPRAAIARDLSEWVAESLAIEWRCQVQRLPAGFPIGHVAARDGVTEAILHILTVQEFPEDFVSIDGSVWREAMRLATRVGVPFIVAVVDAKMQIRFAKLTGAQDVFIGAGDKRRILAVEFRPLRARRR